MRAILVLFSEAAWYPTSLLPCQGVSWETTAMPWGGRFREYSHQSGMLIPLYGEIGWEYPEGLRLYFKGKITEINYEFAS
jgi:hypothetical protein